MDLELKAADLSGLLKSELELELQPEGVTATANDECARERIQIVLTDLVDSGTPSRSTEKIRPFSGPVRRPIACTPG